MAQVKWIRGESVGEEGTIAACLEHAASRPGVVQDLSEEIEQEQEIFCFHCRKFLGYMDPHGPDPLSTVQ